MDKKKTILVVLVALFVVSVVYRYRHPFQQQRVSQLKYAPAREKTAARSGARVQRSMQKMPGYPRLANLDLFLHPPRHSGAVIRNPFFENEGRKEELPSGPPPRPVPVARKPKEVEDPVQVATRELSRFRVFGSFESDGQIVLFIERGRDILVVRKGDWIDGRFQVKEITPNSITIWAKEIKQDINVAVDD